MLNYLISNAIDYTDFLTDKFTLMYTDFDLEDALAEIQDISEPQAMIKGLKLCFEVKEGVPKII
jgi:hypothetical protein